MGIFDALGKVIETSASTIVGMNFGPFAAAATQEVINNTKSEPTIIEGTNIMQGDPVGNIGFTGTPVTQNFQANSSPGFFAPGGALRQGFRDFGGLLGDAAPALNFFGVGQNGLQRANAGTAISINNTRPGETATSGEIMGANLGLGSNILQAATRFARSPGGQSALGFGAGALGAALAPSGSGAPRITRRMKSDVRRIYMMAGMNPDVTAQILNNMGTYPRMNFDANLVFFILTKRFRNDGPVVTKAAVRKTKTTLRRMKGVVDMYNHVCKPTTRRAPARRTRTSTTATLIKN